MIEFLLFLLGGVGLTILFTTSSILQPLRDVLSLNETLEELVHCLMCFGFWVGLATSFYCSYSLLLGAFMTSLASWFLFNLNTYYIAKTNYYINNSEEK